MGNLWKVGLVALVVLLVGIAIAAFFVLRPKPPAGEPTPDVTFPVVDSNNGSVDVIAPPLSITLRDGTTLEVNNFKENGTTIPDVQNQGVYYLAGSPEYCLIDDSCPAAADVSGVNILYNELDDSFTIALLEEPLRETRLRAEQFLLRALGINQSQLCALNYYIGTDSAVNDMYAGSNLGFSMCEGARTLP